MENIRFCVFVPSTGEIYPVQSRAAGEAKASSFARRRLTAAVFDRNKPAEQNPVTVARLSVTGSGTVVEQNLPGNFGTITLPEPPTVAPEQIARGGK